MNYHVLILPSWHSEDGTDGNFIREHARMTASLGHTTGFLYVYKGAIPGRSDIEWSHFNDVVKGTMESWFPPKAPVLIGTWVGLYGKLMKAYITKHGKPDIIHAHGYLAGFAARYLSEEYGMPYLVTEHNTSIPARKIAWFHRASLRRTYRDAARLIAVSRFLKISMQPWAGDTRIDVVYNPVDLTRFGLRSHEDHARPRLIWVGFLEPRKNPVLILDALRELPDSLDFQITMIGAGPMDGNLRSMVSRYRLPVQWLGECTQEEVAAHLAGSDILISSSDLETFGMVLAEAMACGLPVVATDSGGPGEFITDDTGILVPVRNSVAMAAAIQSIASRLDQYDAQSIREYARKTFSFEVIGEKINTIYKSIID